MIDPDVIWSRNNRGACVKEFSADVDHIDAMRHQVLIERRPRPGGGHATWRTRALRGEAIRPVAPSR